MSSSQSWVMDVLFALGGYEALRPDRRPWHELVGYDHSDLEAVFDQARAVDMLPKAFARVAQQIEAEAARAEAAGHLRTAWRFFLRAALLYGRGQYHLYHDSPTKDRLHQQMVRCYEKVIAYNLNPAERVEIPFEGRSLAGVLQYPGGGSGSFPLVLLIPGMDAIKEERHLVAQWFVERGTAVLVLDGPGQGESLLRGIKVTVDNYERAGAAAIDYLTSRGPFDRDRVAVMGTSMGSYWATRITACDSRVKACAVAMGCYGPMDVIFKAARPSFRRNYMYMSGISDEAAFDAMIRQMHLADLEARVRVPYLMVHGEYDELNPLEHALVHYKGLPGPKAVWVFEDEFHPMGRRAADFMPLMLDWIEDRLNGRALQVDDERIYFPSRARGGGRERWEPT